MPAAIMLTIEVQPLQLLMARKLLNLTQAEVARQLSLNINTYSTIESGKSDPKLGTFIPIVQFYTSKGIIFHQNGNTTLKKEA